jgi:hypothetical protein
VASGRSATVANDGARKSRRGIYKRMKRGQRQRPILRYLRIAFSCTCGMACVLLILLWVRSYWKWDQLSTPQWNGVWFAVESVRGELVYWTSATPNDNWSLYTRSLQEVLDEQRRINPHFEFGPHRRVFMDDGMMWVPHRIPIVLFSILATLPWIRWRFSLRTLLIAVMLIAVFLGILSISI